MGELQPLVNNFYSRPCGRGDHNILDPEVLAKGISTHAPAGGATDMASLSFKHQVISTHAPAGGATSCCSARQGRMEISTHAPAGGATEDSLKDWKAGKFLLTPLREGRRAGHCIKSNYNFISTHAPAGGATHIAYYSPRFFLNFYSRPCGRGDGVL